MTKDVNMHRVNAILNDEQFLLYLKKNEEAERERIFCHHDMTHFLDVCRIGYILILKEDLPISQELFYAAGLLHDIGRWSEVETGVDHAQESANLAREILQRHQFDAQETAQILTAIKNHRNKNHTDEFSRILYQSDKLSRNCFSCVAIGECKRFANGEKPELKY